MIDYIEYELFGKPHSHNKTTLKPLMWLTYSGYKKIDFAFEVLSTNSNRKQAIDIFIGNDFLGDVYVDEKKIKLPKGKWRQLVFWVDNGNLEFDGVALDKTIKVHFDIKNGYVSFRNGFEAFSDKTAYCDTDGTAFAIEPLKENEYIIRCEETNGNGNFDSLIFRMKVELGEEVDS